MIFVLFIYSLLIDFKKIKKSKKELFNYFLKNKIKLQIHYLPIYKHPFYKKNFKIKESDFPNSEKFYRQQVSLPIYPDLKYSDLKKIVSKIKYF